MRHTIVIGAQWGDEGKGKVVDWLSDRFDGVVRFQGGHNAGHTVVVDNHIRTLSLLPSGVFQTHVANKTFVIGNGVVVNPWTFLKEMEYVQQLNPGITTANVRVSERAVIVLPLHQELDEQREKNGSNFDLIKIDTTRRGIGPAYEDKVGRRALHLGDLRNLDGLNVKIEHLLHHHNALRVSFDLPKLKIKDVLDPLCKISESIVPFLSATECLLEELLEKGKSILFEGAQGLLLDVDYGTYPYVTSSNTHPAQAFIGSGAGKCQHLRHQALGIFKAYMTRVGHGAFPTEMKDALGARLVHKGKEFGTITGRQRRIGWFDAVLGKFAVDVAGLSSFVLTKTDVFDQVEDIKICIGYKKPDGQIIHHVPYAIDSVEPIYETMPGWLSSTRGIKEIDYYPINAINYIRRLQELLTIPLSFLSTSPNRDDMICIQDI